MPNLENDMQSLPECELFIREDHLPKIIKKHRYLGNIIINAEFHRCKRQGQTGWEFGDGDTKSTFETLII